MLSDHWYPVVDKINSEGSSPVEGQTIVSTKTLFSADLDTVNDFNSISLKRWKWGTWQYAKDPIPGGNPVEIEQNNRNSLLEKAINAYCNVYYSNKFFKR